MPPRKWCHRTYHRNPNTNTHWQIRLDIQSTSIYPPTHLFARRSDNSAHDAVKTYQVAWYHGLQTLASLKPSRWPQRRKSNPGCSGHKGVRGKRISSENRYDTVPYREPKTRRYSYDSDISHIEAFVQYYCIDHKNTGCYGVLEGKHIRYYIRKELYVYLRVHVLIFKKKKYF